VNEALDRPFRPRGVLNAATLEAVMVTVLENPGLSAATLRSRYKKLVVDEKFQTYITGSTTDTLVLRNRIKRAREMLVDA
jgi:hypothetical protein